MLLRKILSYKNANDKEYVNNGPLGVLSSEVSAFKSNYLCVASFLTVNKKKSYAATFTFVYFSPYSLRLCIFCLGRSRDALLCNSFILSARAQMRTGEGRLCDSSLITLGRLWLCFLLQHVLFFIGIYKWRNSVFDVA